MPTKIRQRILNNEFGAAVMWTRVRPEHPIVGERSPAHQAIADTPGR